MAKRRKAKKYVYFFGSGKADGRGTKTSLGGVRGGLAKG